MAVAHVVGGLSLDEGRLFRSHLLECTSCRARVGELRAIAHDLLDVERDERRQRAANRTETKAREGEDADTPVARTSRINGRATLLVAVGLLILMSLSAWNFVLRGQLQVSEEKLDQWRNSIRVLQDGTPWQVSRTGPVKGQVRMLDQSMVILVSGLAQEGEYTLKLLDVDGSEKYRQSLRAVNGVAHAFVADNPQVDAADSVLLIREDASPSASGETTVFEARRPAGDLDTSEVVPLEQVGELAP
jgi:hypothetical protein